MSNAIPASSLSDIYQLLADGHKGYVEAGTRVETVDLARFLVELSMERQEMQQAVGKLIQQMRPGEELPRGTIKGDLHRVWIDLREALTSADDTVMLRECQRGEEYLLERFDTVLDGKDPADEAVAILRAQRSKVAATLSTIKQLRSTTGRAPGA